MDIALQYNAARRKCDVVFTGTDFALDTTPASAMLMSICANRRAHPDDDVPVSVPDWSNPVSFNARGGWCGDALDPTGQLIGGRNWLFVRCLATEETRIKFQNSLAEALGWLDTIRGLAVQIVVRYLPDAPQILAYRVRAGKTEIQIKKALG